MDAEVAENSTQIDAETAKREQKNAVGPFLRPSAFLLRVTRSSVDERVSLEGADVARTVVTTREKRI